MRATLAVSPSPRKVSSARTQSSSARSKSAIRQANAAADSSTVATSEGGRPSVRSSAQSSQRAPSRRCPVVCQTCARLQTSLTARSSWPEAAIRSSAARRLSSSRSTVGHRTATPASSARPTSCARRRKYSAWPVPELCFRLGALFEAGERVGADRLEHREARLAVGLLFLAQEAVVDERREAR